MLYTMKDLLAVAKKNKFAVPAYNISSYEIMKAIIEVCEETNTPVILEIHPDEIAYLGDKFIPTVMEYAKTATVPVVVHCDHGGTLFDIVRAINNGYTSVMIDASSCDFEENVRRTQETVKLAHQVGISVEAELGTIGNTGTSHEGGSDKIIYTDPVKAKEFVERTNIDTLAIAIGTAHGKYPKEWTPKLNIELLKELNKVIDIPMVLHGGSGNPDSEVSESVNYGVCKVNISTDVKSVFFDSMRKYLTENPDKYEPMDVYVNPVEDIKKVIKHKFTILNTLGKADLY